ncbi:hypothetical protein [Pseudanabaena yagii]|uniref:Uncharacterized protein n=1 Tax=Pseudanabaena yagii GIHE-NHR1 TaxID=2722753 RepID=A0ABX1LX41_9CYAN|nr:hypothetical protein [Pseudanabaena yagii]NMF60739.1 hypothetical protein [Pseudanabaena yagii GIHE-NHR1]
MLPLIFWVLICPSYLLHCYIYAYYFSSLRSQTLGVMAYCIWQIFSWFVAMIISGSIAGYSILQIITLFVK